MRKLFLLATFVFGLGASAWAEPGQLQLTINSGRVTLIADQVPVRTILQEWARLGQSKIVNGEKVPGPPLTLRLIDVPEEQALDIVLRSASGYLAAPRAMQIANASRFDRIFVLPTSRPSSTAPPPPVQQQPQPQGFPANPAMQAPMAEDVEIEEEEEEPNDPVDPEGEVPPAPVVSPRPGPIQVTPPNPDGVQPPQPGQQPVPQTMPGQPPVPVVSPRPGVIQPQQPQPQPPQQPARPIP
jgi:hypothetical protein